MPPNAEEYRKHAAECFRMAERSAKEDDKAQWLAMAETWLRMAQQVDGTISPIVGAQVSEPIIAPDLPPDPEKIS